MLTLINENTKKDLSLQQSKFNKEVQQALEEHRYKLTTDRSDGGVNYEREEVAMSHREPATGNLLK